METKRWLAFANRKRCNHAQALRELGFINWTMNRVNFNIGDIVYLFISDERCVRFKTIVVDKDCRREDSCGHTYVSLWRKRQYALFHCIQRNESHQM